MNINGSLTLQDYQYLSKLIESGVGLNDALKIIESPTNHKIVNEIILGLLEGQGIDYLIFKNGRQHQLFILFNRLYSLDKSISIVISYVERKQTFLKNMVANLLYPIIIILTSFIVLTLGAFWLVPQIISMFESMDVESSKLMLYFAQFVVIIMSIVILSSIFLIIAGIYCYYKKLFMKIYINSKYNWLRKIMHRLISYIYLNEYYIFLKNNLTTKEIQDLMLGFEVNSIEFYVASLLEDKLEAGENFEAALGELTCFDERAKKLIAIGYITSSLVLYLKVYLDESEQKFKQFIKTMVIGIQGLSYLSVGICVLIITNLMFAPLSVLEGF